MTKTAKLSKRKGDQLWAHYKIQNLQIAQHYYQLSLKRHSDRVLQCSSNLFFKYGYAQNGVIPKKLQSADCCRVRWCLICQWRRSKRWQAKAFQSLPAIQKEYPDHRWLFLTLSAKNCHITDLRETIAWLNLSFKHWTKRIDWPADGWVKSLEVTRSEEDGSAHPHFHILLLVPPEYFQI